MGDDYHDVLQKKLFDLIDFVKSESGKEVVSRVYVDTGPVIDRVYAKYAGIGWFGKNTCIINQQKGSWFFIGEIITNLELAYDTPVPDRCGSCQKCIDACPTDAILEPYVLDSRRCISYLTIELKGAIPEHFRAGIGNHVFGCDICQDVCPWNRRAAVTSDRNLNRGPGSLILVLTSWVPGLLKNSGRDFDENPVKRTKYHGLLRNVVVAMGNSGDKAFVPKLKELAHGEDSMIAEHARWALNQITKQVSELAEQRGHDN